MEREEIIKIIQQLYTTHRNLATVGGILRDEYLILSVKEKYNVSLKKLFLEGNAKFLDDSIITNVNKCIKLRNHLKENKKDLHNRRIFDLSINKLFRFVNYHKKSNKFLNLKKVNLESLEILINKYFL